MLKIRGEQMDVMAQAAMRGFEQRVAQHLNEHFPEECRRAGPERIAAAIRQGVARAARYGITSELDVVRYLDLSVVLGLDFDSGKRYPWAQQILEDRELDADEKIDALFDRLDAMQIRELDAVIGDPDV